MHSTTGNMADHNSRWAASHRSMLVDPISKPNENTTYILHVQLSLGFDHLVHYRYDDWNWRPQSMGMSKTQEFSKSPPSVGGLLRVHWLYRSELWQSLCSYSIQVSNWRSPQFWGLSSEISTHTWHSLLDGASSRLSCNWRQQPYIFHMVGYDHTSTSSHDNENTGVLANDLDKDSLPSIPTTQDYWACSRISTKWSIIRNEWSDSRCLTHFVRWDDEQWWK